MAENIGGPSAPYNTKIPSITDSADIQTALRLYHYGSNTSTPSVVPEESIAGHLNVLDNSKIDKTPTVIPADADPNDYTETGYYAQPSTPLVTTNYPSPYAGMLTVSNSGGSIFQQYQVVGAPESETTANPLNRVHWRFYFAGQWRPWRTYVDSSEFSSLGDGRYVQGIGGNPTFISNYYTKSSADNLFYTKQSATAAQYVPEVDVTDSSYVLAVGDQSKVISVSTAAATTITIPLNSASTGNFPIGTIINIYSQTDSDVFVAAAVGVALRPFENNRIKLFGKYTEISLRKRDDNEWVASGNILAV